MNMKFFLKNSNEKTLVLIDEFGTGTEPLLGGAIAESILAQLNEMNTFGVITTHYTNLKHFASSTEGIENARHDVRFVQNGTAVSVRHWQTRKFVCF